MTEFEAKAVADAINRMFKAQSFSICTVRGCMEITGATRTSDYDALHLYHCVNYDKMDAQTKRFVFRATVENVCNVDEFPEITLAMPSEKMESLMIAKLPEPEETREKRQSLIERLFGS